MTDDAASKCKVCRFRRRTHRHVDISRRHRGGGPSGDGVGGRGIPCEEPCDIRNDEMATCSACRELARRAQAEDIRLTARQRAALSWVAAYEEPSCWTRLRGEYANLNSACERARNLHDPAAPRIRTVLDLKDAGLVKIGLHGDEQNRITLTEKGRALTTPVCGTIGRL